MLLIWSSTYGFCTDSFTRVFIREVPWYGERRLRNVSMGSLLVLIMTRLVTGNLNRMEDGYLLGNTLAVIINVKVHVRNLDEVRERGGELKEVLTPFAQRRKHNEREMRLT
jgi:hypothetical protein